MEIRDIANISLLRGYFEQRDQHYGAIAEGATHLDSRLGVYQVELEKGTTRSYERV